MYINSYILSIFESPLLFSFSFSSALFINNPHTFPILLPTSIKKTGVRSNFWSVTPSICITASHA